MKKKNIFSRIIIWSFLLSPMFVSCTQDEFFDESCMYSTNASRFSGAGIEMTTTSSARASNTNSTTGMGAASPPSPAWRAIGRVCSMWITFLPMRCCSCATIPRERRSASLPMRMVSRCGGKILK